MKMLGITFTRASRDYNGGGGHVYRAYCAEFTAKSWLKLHGVVTGATIESEVRWETPTARCCDIFFHSKYQNRNWFVSELIEKSFILPTGGTWSGNDCFEIRIGCLWFSYDHSCLSSDGWPVFKPLGGQGSLALTPDLLREWIQSNGLCRMRTETVLITRVAA